MFRFTRKPSSGNYNQYLAKTYTLVKSRYVEAVQDVVSVVAAYCEPVRRVYTRLTGQNIQP